MFIFDSFGKRIGRVFSTAAAFILLLLLIFLASSCGRELPPDNGTPAPAALDGVFTSEAGSLTFNGDGRTVILDLDADFAQKAGLPAGWNEGVFVFLFRNEEWRYDLAETVRFTAAGVSRSFANAIGVTGENAVSFVLSESGERVVFKKTAD